MNDNHSGNGDKMQQEKGIAYEFLPGYRPVPLSLMNRKSVHIVPNLSLIHI